MSMPIEDAIKLIRIHMELDHIGQYPHIKLGKALTMAIDALQEKAECENPKPLTIEELRQMHGEPVWLAVCHKWGLVHVDDYGQLKGKPLVQVIDRGIVFTRDIEKGNLLCYRHKPKEET